MKKPESTKLHWSPRSPFVRKVMMFAHEGGLEPINRKAVKPSASPFGVGHIAIGCAPGSIDFRFGELRWRDAHAAIARRFEEFAKRHSAVLVHPDLVG